MVDVIHLTKQYIRGSLDTFPVEFLDMQSNYRVLHGEDVLAELEISREHLRLQCERKLKVAALKLRREYVNSSGNPKALCYLADESMKTLLPVFKGLLVLGGRSIPNTKNDLISAIEDECNFGSSALSDVFHSDNKGFRKNFDDLFERFVAIIGKLIAIVDQIAIKEA